MIRFTRPLLVCSLALLPVAALAYTSRASEAVAPAVATPAGGSLEDAMQALQAGQQRLGKTVDKKDAAAALDALAEMQAAVHTAKLGTPPKAAELTDAAAKTAFVLGYRKQLIDLERVLLDVEIALLDGKLDEAKKLLDEKVKPSKKSGHDKYKG